MGNNKTDQLFREKLARHEMSPSSEAWKTVNGELMEKKSPVIWMRVAAAITVLGVASFLVWRSGEIETKGELATFSPDAPTKEGLAFFDIPQIKSDKVEAKTIKSTIQKISTSKTVLAKERSTEKTIEKVYAMPESVVPMGGQLAGNELMIASELHPLDINKTEFQTNQVAIQTEPEEEKNGFKKMIERARDIKPGEMWASIRETKNDFFAGSNNN